MPHVRDIAWTGEDYFMVTSSAGVYRSKDALTWSHLDGKQPVKGYPRSIAANDDTIVVVGDSGFIETRADNRQWIKQELGEDRNLYKVTWLGGQFVAVGGCGAVALSKDGIKWNVTRTNLPELLLDVAWNHNRYVAVGVTPSSKANTFTLRLLVSDDEKLWRDISSTVDNLYEGNYRW